MAPEAAGMRLAARAARDPPMPPIAILRTPLAPAPANDTAAPPGPLVACHDCDALQVAPAAPARALCFRCGAHLAVGGPDHLDRALAFTLAAIPLFLTACWFPLVRLEDRGSSATTTVLGAARALAAQNLPVVAALVLATTLVLPALAIALGTYLLLAVRRRRIPAGVTLAFRTLLAIRPWTQIEILLLGLLVAFGKLAAVFQMSIGLGLPCLVLLLLVERAASWSLDPAHFWARVQAIGAKDHR
jgi:paraquat-inducible protein A